MGEKQGTFTNVNRTVHLSDKAVEPPGEARSDLDIFCDYARLMDFRDRDGEPLIRWSDPGLYADGVFPTDPTVCEDYGHDLLTGGSVDEQSYRARRPDGRAFLKTSTRSRRSSTSPGRSSARLGKDCATRSCSTSSPPARARPAGSCCGSRRASSRRRPRR